MQVKDQSYKLFILVLFALIGCPFLYGAYEHYTKLTAQVRAISVFTIQRHMTEALTACNREIADSGKDERLSVDNGGRDASYFWYVGGDELQVAIRITGQKLTCYFYGDGRTVVQAKIEP